MVCPLLVTKNGREWEEVAEIATASTATCQVEATDSKELFCAHAEPCLQRRDGTRSSKGKASEVAPVETTCLSESSAKLSVVASAPGQIFEQAFSPGLINLQLANTKNEVLVFTSCCSETHTMSSVKLCSDQPFRTKRNKHEWRRVASYFEDSCPDQLPHGLTRHRACLSWRLHDIIDDIIQPYLEFREPSLLSLLPLAVALFAVLFSAFSPRPKKQRRFSTTTYYTEGEFTGL